MPISNFFNGFAATVGVWPYWACNTLSNTPYAEAFYTYHHFTDESKIQKSQFKGNTQAFSFSLFVGLDFAFYLSFVISSCM